MKLCKACHANLPPEAFSPDKRSRDGLQSRCKACRTTYQRQYRLAHPEKTQEINARSYARHADKRRAYQRAYARRNRAARKAYMQRWSAENAERRRDYHRNYRKRNSARIREYERHRDHLERTNHADLGVDDWPAIKAMWGERCVYCYSQGGLEMEHVIPVSNGGGHTWDNVVPACRSCNARKKDRTLLTFLLVGLM